MNNLTYLELYKRDPKIARLLLVNHYLETKSVSKTARKFKTTRNTMRKALRRYKDGGESALSNRSTRPKGVEPGSDLESTANLGENKR